MSRNYKDIIHGEYIVRTFENGDVYWMKENFSGSAISYVLHRLDGPAVEYSDGTKYWCQNDKYYRLDGPAVERADGCKEWWIDDERVNCSNQEEFERLVRLRAFW